MKFHFQQKRLPLQLSFLIFSMLLNSMGIVILKYSTDHVAYSGLGILEAFKDLPIALTSLLAVRWIKKRGRKTSLLMALLVVAICCLLLPLVDSFWFFKVWLSMIGATFAVSKIAVFGLMKSNTAGEQELSKVMSRVEAAFMIGIFAVNTGFGWLLSGSFSDEWKFGFWGIGLLAAANAILIYRTPYLELTLNDTGKADTRFTAFFKPKTLIFFLIIFLIVFTEQSLNSWLPTFYKARLGANAYFALQATAFLALFSYAGRVATSRFIIRFKWYPYILTCILALIVLLGMAQLFVLKNAESTVVLWLFPIVGLFLSPLYPLVNSRLIATTSEQSAGPLVSLIVVCSSLGSSLGSFFCSLLFHYGHNSFYPLYSAMPIIVMLFIMIFFNKVLSSHSGNNYL